MAQRTTPGIGLTSDYNLGENGWKEGMDANLLKLSALVNCAVEGMVATLPSTPSEGAMYIVTSGANANRIALRDQSAWVFYTPKAGFFAYVKSYSQVYVFSTGSAWTPVLGEFGDLLASAEQAAIDAEADRAAIEVILTDVGDWSTALADHEGRIDILEELAFDSGQVYANTTAGLAGTTVGVQFKVANADPNIAFDLYSHDSGDAATKITEIPSSVALSSKVDVTDFDALDLRTSALKRTTNSATGMPTITDANGVELLGFDTDGKAILRLSSRAMAAVLSDLADLGFKQTVTEAFPSLKDANNVELLGFDQYARARFLVSPYVAQQVFQLVDFLDVYDPAEVGLLSSPSGVVVGDSMSTGTVTTAVSTALSGREFSTLAKGGHTAYSMSVVMGVNPLLVTLSGDEIPASGGVAVTAKNVNILSSGGTNSGTANVTIEGVPGVMSTDASGNWTFTRTTAGSVVAVSPDSPAVLNPDVGTSYIPATNAYRGRTAVLRLGRNGTRTSRSARVTYTLEPLRQIIDFLTPLIKNIVVVNVYNGRAKDYVSGDDLEGSNTAAYADIMTLNEELQREFGRLYLDMRSAAVKNAIYDLGLTPSADDLADIALDSIPRQLFGATDNVHVSTTMQGWEGEFMGNHLRALGF